MSKYTNKQIRHLRSLAHERKPVVIIGDKGLTQGVVDEIKNALEIHELIKVKIRTEEREDRNEMINLITQRTGSTQVQLVGHIVTLFKRSKEAKIPLPKS
ncbi:ribosome assembly RNA-binding protein YhbY [Aliikangiella marina]|uniref:Ribosome assembly RNA-binding protein YhbY n=1 Tax=Aliikangiella marina TaxID=1712262 RepID=A0A545T9B7_9GAMM|nr:ribosome assembly RNA-binding protein YhbY [Aliikangiella marina]TQV73802.1 ribosome assembly RNA-binding protein YhbY [Aliikangiella marina]